jgi:arginine decarboxylase
MIPRFFFLTKGVGKHKDYLQSFELALRSAGIHRCNIVNVSSIIPPGCKRISSEKGLKMLKPGEITVFVDPPLVGTWESSYGGYYGINYLKP